MLVDYLAMKDVGHAIQLALAPVFLLTGIASTLSVMIGRLARIVDRGRQVTESRIGNWSDDETAAEVEGLERRRHLASAAITATTFSALLVCLVIAALFVDVLLAVNLKYVVGILFAGSSLALIVGLGYFLREVRLATKTTRIEMRRRQPAR